jgi:hypothetical protein
VQSICISWTLLEIIFPTWLAQLPVNTVTLRFVVIARLGISESETLFKVTTVQADAADDATIKALCERAIREVGRLDVFFANVGGAGITVLPILEP